MLFSPSKRQAPTFANYFAGPGQHEALRTIKNLVAGTGPGGYLWGEAGTGKSHLLSAALAAATRRGRRTARLVDSDPSQPPQLVVADNIDCLDETAQQQLMALLNHSAQTGTVCVLAAGRRAPGKLKLRADVASRLTALPAYLLAKMDEDELASALALYATRLGRARLAPDIAQLLVLNLPRRMTELCQAMDNFDHAVQTANKPLTAKTARQWLATSRLRP